MEEIREEDTALIVSVNRITHLNLQTFMSFKLHRYSPIDFKLHSPRTERHQYRNSHPTRLHSKINTRQHVRSIMVQRKGALQAPGIRRRIHPCSRLLGVQLTCFRSIASDDSISSGKPQTMRRSGLSAVPVSSPHVMNDGQRVGQNETRTQSKKTVRILRCGRMRLLVRIGLL